MISPHALGALRVAATLTHSLPGLRARVRLDEGALLDVVAPDGAVDGRPVWVGGARMISPCAFRRAVGHAHRNPDGGGSRALLDQPPEWVPAIDISVPRSGAARPGGLYRVPIERRSLWGFAVTLDPTTAHRVGADLVDAVMPLDGVLSLGIRPDEATGVSIAFAEITAPPGSIHEAVVVDLLESLLARWAVHELVASIDEVSSGTE
jgi:hypothetical protein